MCAFLLCIKLTSRTVTSAHTTSHWTASDYSVMLSRAALIPSPSPSLVTLALTLILTVTLTLTLTLTPASFDAFSWLGYKRSYLVVRVRGFRLLSSVVNPFA